MSKSLRDQSMSKSKTGSTKDPTAKRANTLRKVKYLQTSCVCARVCMYATERECVRESVSASVRVRM